MSDLAAWLLQQITDDEQPTWTLAPYPCEPGCCAPEGWVGSQCRYCDATPVYGGTVEAITSSAEEHAEAIHQRSHVLAEGEAKRRIVELHTVDDVMQRCAEDQARHPCATLRLLAAPYADRPGYQEAWRP